MFTWMQALWFEQTFSKDSTSALVVVSSFDSSLSLSSQVDCVLGLLSWGFPTRKPFELFEYLLSGCLEVGKKDFQLSQWSLGWVDWCTWVGEEAGDCDCIREKQVPVCHLGTYFPSHPWVPILCCSSASTFPSWWAAVPVSKTKNLLKLWSILNRKFTL